MAAELAFSSAWRTVARPRLVRFLRRGSMSFILSRLFLQILTRDQQWESVFFGTVPRESCKAHATLRSPEILLVRSVVVSERESVAPLAAVWHDALCLFLFESSARLNLGRDTSLLPPTSNAQ